MRVSQFLATVAVCGLSVSAAYANTTYFNLAGGNLAQNWSSVNLISVNDSWNDVPSITGYLGNINAATGADARDLTAATVGTVDVIANAANPNTLGDGGVAEFAIPNPTVALQGSNASTTPSLIFFLNAMNRQSVSISFNLRDLDGSTDNAVQQINIQYRLTPGGVFTNVPNGYFADVTTGPSLATAITPVSVTLPSETNNANQLQVRVLTTNATGNDEWVGIDDINITSAVIPEANTFGLFAFALPVIGAVIARRRKSS